MKKILLSVLSLLTFVVAKAEIVLPKIFSDNMVLQRQMPVKIWGKADAEAIVGVEFSGQKIETKASKDGGWVLHLRPLKSSSTPSSMKIYENGTLAAEVANILVGEVWVAGGQSNMQWSLAQIKVLDKSPRGNNPMIRMFTQPHNAASKTPEYDSPENAKWELSEMDNFRSFSAISFFFAEELSKNLKTPIGIIQTSLGGSKMVPWLDIADTKDNLAFEYDMKAFHRVYDENYDYEKALEAWEESRKEYFARKKAAKANDEEFTEALPKTPNKFGNLSVASSPAYLYNAKVAPIAGYSARGFIWYQGESDVGNVEKFAGKFETIIRSWRKYWGGRPMPFYFVQLPSYGKAKENWVEARWQQYLTKQKFRLVEMVVSLDTGEENNIHPADKEIISKRMAKIAQKRVYNDRFMTGEYGPIFKASTYNGDTVKVQFNTFSRKLILKGELRGFEILVGDNWVLPEFSKADLKTSSVILKAPKGKEIKGVRYLWKAWAKPDVCLYSDLNLPAMGFRDEKKDAPEPQAQAPEKPVKRIQVQLPEKPQKKEANNKPIISISMGDGKATDAKPKENTKANIKNDKNDENL